jgi:hypothetical protein
MNKQNRNDQCECGSGKKYKYCHGIKESEVSINADHITFGGSSLIRSSSDIHSTTVKHFKQFQINQGEVIGRIKETPFNCKVTVEDCFAVFELIRDDIVLTRTACCFGQGLELSKKFLNEVRMKSLKSIICRLFSSTEGKSRKPQCNFWLYTFIIGIMTPSEALLAGEIEFYIYDAIRRGLSVKPSTTGSSK